MFMSFPCMVMQVLFIITWVGSVMVRWMTFKFLSSQVTMGRSLHASNCSPRVQAATGCLPSGPESDVASSDAASARYLKCLSSANGSKVM